MSGSRDPLADDDVLREYLALRERAGRILEALLYAAETADRATCLPWVRRDASAYRECLERLRRFP